MWRSIFIIKLISSSYFSIQSIILWFLYLEKLLIFYLLCLINFLLVGLVYFIFNLTIHQLNLLFCNFRLIIFWFSNLFFSLAIWNIQSSGSCIIRFWKFIKFICYTAYWLCLFYLRGLFLWLLNKIDFFYDQI